ncbi:hypothetical protein ACLPJK_25730 [Pseudomonas aeruginosa]|uniref:hypothetical protein n=1 Tax=Pseudomonas aeruginosa TaxID=287 RepID=UPI003D2CB747
MRITPILPKNDGLLSGAKTPAKTVSSTKALGTHHPILMLTVVFLLALLATELFL